MKTNFIVILMVSLLAGSISIISLTSGQEGTNVDGIQHISLVINSEVRYHYAVTEFTASLRNPSTMDQEDIFTLEVPNDAMLSNLTLEIEGEQYYASVASTEEAKERYDEAKENNDTASQVTSSVPGEFQFYINIAPQQDLNITIRYEQVISKVLGLYNFDLAMDSIEGYSSFDEVETRVSITGMGDIKPLDVSRSTIDLEQVWDGNRTVILDHSTSSPKENDRVAVSFGEVLPPAEGRLQTYIDGEKGYFMHVFSPQLQDVGSYLPKDIIFILDRSGSMEGQKISQMKEAFNEVVDQLHEEDRFDLITFSSEVDTWKGEIVDATNGNKESAKSFISLISSGGSTNIIDALTSGLGQMELDQNRVPVIVFLTDGQPTSGSIQNPKDIRERIIDENKGEVTIYSLGFGDDLDLEFIKALSLENNGFAIAIPEGGDASSLMTGFYDTISTPLVKDLRFDYSGMAFDIIPTRLPSLYQGSEAVIVGRFDPYSTSITSNVSGFTSTGMRYWEKSFDVVDNEDNEFIERLWAHRTILRILDDITIEGETDALIERVTSLALNYSFVTPYTSFILVIESNEDGSEVTDDDSIGNDQTTDGNYSNGGKGSFPGINDRTPGDDDAEYIENNLCGLRWWNWRAHPINPSISDEKEDISMIFLIISVGITLLIILIVGVVIYTRLRDDELLKQENRKKIYEHIMNSPGDHFRAIQRAVELEVGTLSHHMNILEKEQLIVSEQDGNNRCFWVAGVKRDTGKIRLSRIQENILKEIHDEPGITQVQIARRVGVSRKVVFYHVKFLANAEMVLEEKVKRRAHYYPTD